MCITMHSSDNVILYDLLFVCSTLFFLKLKDHTIFGRLKSTLLELRCYLHSKLPPSTLNTMVTWGCETISLTFFDHEPLYHETSLFLHKITGEI